MGNFQKYANRSLSFASQLKCLVAATVQTG